MHLLVWSIIFFCVALVIAAIAVVAIMINFREKQMGGAFLASILYGSLMIFFSRIGYDFLKSRVALFLGQYGDVRTTPTAFALLAYVLGAVALILLWLFLDRANTAVSWFTVVGAASSLASAICAGWTGFAVKKALVELKNGDQSL